MNIHKGNEMSDGCTYMWRELKWVETQALINAISHEVHGPFKWVKGRMKDSIISWTVDVRYSEVIERKQGSISRHDLYPFRNKRYTKYWSHP